MKKLDYLHYTNNKPYREILWLVAKENTLNPHEAHKKAAEFELPINEEQVKRALIELELRGLLIRVNDCFTIAEDWLRELVLFLNEFEVLQGEIDHYNTLLQKKEG